MGTCQPAREGLFLAKWYLRGSNYAASPLLSKPFVTLTSLGTSSCLSIPSLPTTPTKF